MGTKCCTGSSSRFDLNEKGDNVINKLKKQ